MKTGDILNEKYRIEKLLGKGGTGFVYLCTNIELGNKWALKHIPTTAVSNRSASEIDILKKLYHISLPRIADVFTNQQGLYIVESNIEGVNLDSLLRQEGSFEIGRVVDWSLELCDILEYLHQLRPRPIIYRDLKPANIMVTRGNRLVLVDFGISKEYCGFNAEDTYLAGTCIYAAPEQLIKGGTTDGRTDIYNLGATMYELLHGRPYRLKDNKQKNRNSKTIARFNEVISRCLENKPEDRYQKVENISMELQAIKSRLVIEAARKRTIHKIEAVIVVILSIVTYAVTFLGIIGALPY